MKPPYSTTLASDEIEALVRGRHPDPFSRLGPHGAGSDRVVRAVHPHATNLWLKESSGRRVAMRKVHDEGLFEGPLRPRLRRYSLVAEGEDWETEYEDAYRFGSTLGELDLHLLGEGSHLRIFETLGAHTITMAGVRGTRFAVWAPNACRVSVVGPFNDWDGRRHVMRRHHDNGVWEIFVPGVRNGELYKFEVLDALGNVLPLKADPCAHRAEPPPGNASIVWSARHQWQDDDWMAANRDAPDLGDPLSIYEVHLGSWRRHYDGRFYTYRELADHLVDYVRDLGFTHIELLPVTEFPFDGSWGYQPVGLYAPTHRFGSPDDFRYFVDRCHQAGIGVIIDWVPAHFPRDAHGLARFDGTALYEHEDPRRGEHADWGTLIFNYGRREVLNYLIGSALYWIESFHIDGLRVDAVASMLYLDYSREHGQWLPNEYGGNENLEAVAFLRRLNEAVHERGAITLAEESTAWPGVSRPVYAGGLGFTYKWNMGWMNDTLRYMQQNPLFRKFHHDKLTFGLVYAFDENFVLPLSHDEVVHGKGSLLGRMPGDPWQRLANLRAYLGFMFLHPGKKLLFMGAEMAQAAEWSHERELDWWLLESPEHAGVLALVRALNRRYTDCRPLHELDCDGRGFEWINWEDGDNSVLTWIRRDSDGQEVICVCNFTPVVRGEYRIGAPSAGTWTETLNTDRPDFGGSGVMNEGPLETTDEPANGRKQSLLLTLPPLATILIEKTESS